LLVRLVTLFFLFALTEDGLSLPATMDHVAQDLGANDLCTQSNAIGFVAHSLNYAWAQ
jgi:hypothetical protein